MSFRMIPLLACCLSLWSCAGNSADEWKDIDYSKVHRSRGDIDSGYVQPSVISCVDDDLYNCR